jgi:hypothetical protein
VVTHISVGKVYLFAVALLVKKGVINPHLVIAIKEQVSNCSADVTGPAYNKNFHSFSTMTNNDFK